MPRVDYLITVVDTIPLWKWRHATAKTLVACGVPLPVAARWERVRREMSPRGLARKARENRQ